MSHVKVQMALPAPLKVSTRGRNSLQRDTLYALVPALMDTMSLCSLVIGRVARHPMNTSPCPWPYEHDESMPTCD